MCSITFTSSFTLSKTEPSTDFVFILNETLKCNCVVRFPLNIVQSGSPGFYCMRCLKKIIYVKVHTLTKKEEKRLEINIVAAPILP